MPRARRRIESRQMYEICFRAREGLPLVAYKIIELFIKHAVSNAQRDDKVELCHDLWNGSHPHAVLVTKDARACTAFYGETQKRITDCIKRLLGLSHRRIWEGRASVIKICSLEHAIERIAYLYANPAQDDLEVLIERFPGYSSYSDFLKTKDLGLSAVTKVEVPALKLPMIPKATTTGMLTWRQDANLVRLLTKRCKETQPLIRFPNAWMRCFGVTSDKDVAEINLRIHERLRQKERDAKTHRGNKPVFGRANLQKQPILKPHTPKKQDRKIFFLGLSKLERIAFIEEFKEFSRRCKECYQACLRGEINVPWPPGAFKPPIPPNMNMLSFA